MIWLEQLYFVYLLAAKALLELNSACSCRVLGWKVIAGFLQRRKKRYPTD